MFVLIAVVVAGCVGLAAHYLLPHRDRRGVAVAPLAGAVAAGVIYTALQWVGLAESSIWLWLASLGVGILVAIFGTMALTRLRMTRDAARAEALGLTPR